MKPNPVAWATRPWDGVCLAPWSRTFHLLPAPLSLHYLDAPRTLVYTSPFIGNAVLLACQANTSSFLVEFGVNWLQIPSQL